MFKEFDPRKHERQVARLCRRIRHALYFQRNPRRAQVLARTLERIELRVPLHGRLVIGEGGV